MKREIYWYHSAVELVLQLSARNSRQATRIALAPRNFGASGTADIKKLEGSDRWRLRAGDWRIFLRLDGPEAWVVGLSDRQDAY